MPEFAWEPLEFLEALGVVPEEEEYGISYRYVVTRPGLRLELSIWPMDPDVRVRIYSEAQVEPIAKFDLLNCPGARVVRDKRGLGIEFAGGTMFGGRYDHTGAAPYGMMLWLEPFVQLEPYPYAYQA
ncbi:hypothetical protein ACG04R_24590 [Roseateles sp. BYS78W]|uniref:Uncharacterized protein n=1 Tax=Pelomonas candidula TaxID=3299025 RepID=A0ABW7HK65_9BURK